jgi:Tol biopolymer transport system component
LATGSPRFGWTLSLLTACTLVLALAGTSPVLPLALRDSPQATVRSAPAATGLTLDGAITFARSTGRTIEVLTLDLASGDLYGYDTGPGTATSPAWSPTNDRLVFARRSGNPYHLMDLDPLTGSVRQLTQGTAIDGHPSIAPDGEWLAFASNRGPGATFALYRLDLAPVRAPQATVLSQQPEYLTDGRAPHVAPGGQRVWFERNGRAWLLDLTTGATSPVTPVAERHTSPQVAPDGRSLLTARELSDQVQITVTDLTTGQQRALTRGFEDRAPAWSPDGQHVVFVRVVAAGSDLYVVPAAGGRPIRMTDEPAADIAPTWHAN